MLKVFYFLYKSIVDCISLGHATLICLNSVRTFISNPDIGAAFTINFTVGAVTL